MTSRPRPSSIPVTRVRSAISTPEPAGGVGDRVGRDVRVHVSVAGDPDAAVQRVPGRVRQALEHLVGAEQLGLEPERERPAGRALQVGPGLRLDAMRTLPTALKTPSSRYSATL